MKSIVQAYIAVHPVQAKLINKLKDGEIRLGVDSLRDMANKIELESESPQQIKFHLEQLVKLGIVQKVHGEYWFDRNPYTIPIHKIDNQQ